MQKWEDANIFVELALSIDQHFPGYVDAYYGPRETLQAIEQRGEVPFKELERIASDLVDSISQDSSLNPGRKEFLTGEVGAMQTTLRILQGEAPGFIEEVQSLYGLTPSWTNEKIFEATHKKLDELLPGSGPLVDRFQSFREQLMISAETAAPIIKRLADDVQSRTRQRLILPADESCEYKFVKDKPWGAYNWYLGNYRSRIEINLDNPIRVYTLPHFITHEAYPGHHTEHSVKEQKYYRELGLLEYCILLSNTPAAVISEGIAECALELIFSPEELVDIYQQILEETGLSNFNGRLIYEFVHIASRPLRKVGDNELLLLHDKGASDDEVIAYGRRYGLSTEKEETKYLQFAKDPLWRSYGFNYSLGYELISKLLSSTENKDRMFTRLLQESMTPAQVQRMVLQQ
jgi:hypothetical protein